MEHFKEIGGNFPLNYSELDIRTEILIQHESPYFFSSGRSAIMAMIQLANAQGKKVALPYFTCHSVIEPFDKMGCEIIYYPTEINLKVDVSTMIKFCDLEQPYLLLYHDYFGLNEGGEWNLIFNEFKHRLIFVNDQTHSFFSAQKNHSSHYSLMSIRKWGGISEGGFLKVLAGSNRGLIYENRPEDDLRLECYTKASQLKDAYLKGDTLVSKDDFRRLFYQSESFFDAENGIFPINQIGIITWNKLLESDFAVKRSANFQALEDGWLEEWRNWGIPVFEYSIGITPLYFPVLLRIERLKLQTFLAHQRVYAPIIWPKSTLIQSNGDDTLYNQLLCIPIDQRYGEDEMKCILKLLADFHLWICDDRN